MKSLKSLLIASVRFFGISALVLSSSCEQDPCLDLDCKQGASCSEGFCQCPVGYEGSECEITAASRFVGKYVGISQCNQDPQKTDTATIVLDKDPNKVILRIGMGRTSVISYGGIASTPEIQFEEINDGAVAVHPAATVDGNQLTVSVETRVANNQRSMCKFVGVKIEE